MSRYTGATGEFRKDKPIGALRMGDWKAVRAKPDAALELYNLRDDLGEQTDLAAKRPELVAKFEAKMAAERTEPRKQPDPIHRWWTTKY